MPIQQCTLPDGGKGFKWGNKGKCFSKRADAAKQAAAAFANGYQGTASKEEKEEFETVWNNMSAQERIWAGLEYFLCEDRKGL